MAAGPAPQEFPITDPANALELATTVTDATLRYPLYFNVRLNAEVEHIFYLKNEGTISGIGLFAGQQFQQDAELLVFQGEAVTQAQANARQASYVAQGLESNYLIEMNGANALTMDATHIFGVERYANHCCFPNMEAVEQEINGQRRIYFTALRDINEDEEVTIDYNMKPDIDDNLDDPQFTCNCNVQGCRGSMIRRNTLVRMRNRQLRRIDEQRRQNEEIQRREQQQESRAARAAARAALN